MKNFNKILGFTIALLIFTTSFGEFCMASEITSDEMIQSAELWCTELEELFADCDALGITACYDKADYEIVKRFAKELETEADSQKISYYHDVLQKLYNKVRQNLTNYINGSDLPIKVEKKDYNSLEFKNGRYYTREFNDEETILKPVVAGGYSSWQANEENIEFANAIGSSTMGGTSWQQNNVIAFANGFLMKNTFADEEIEKIKAHLDLCKKLNLVTSFGFDLMHLPGNMKYWHEYEGFVDEEGVYDAYMPFNPTHPAATLMLNAQAEILFPIIKEYDCVAYISLGNETRFEAYDKPYYFDEWTKYLEILYDGSIEALNDAYGTTHTDFSQVKMPQTPSETAIYYDYREFTTDILYEYFSNAKSIVKRFLPDMPVGFKAMHYTRTMKQTNSSWNTKYEKYHDIFDINLNDSFAYYDKEGLTIQGKMMWYDYLRSVIDAAVVNGENHVIQDKTSDGTFDYASIIPKHVATDMWQGAIHGTALTYNWLIADNETTQTNYPNPTVLSRPDLASAVGRTTLDMERLSDEIFALSEKEAEIAILYSDITWNYDSTFFETLYNTYTSVLYNGQNVEFITERDVEKLSNQKLLIVPKATHSTDEMVNKIKAFKDNGGDVLFVGNNCLKYDKHNKALSAASKRVVADLYNSAMVVQKGTSVEDAVKNYFKNKNISIVELIDVDTNEKIANTEWISEMVDGEKIINVCYYGEENSSKKVKVIINGIEANKIKDLRNDNYYLNEFTINAYEPMLISASVPEKWGDNIISDYVFAREEGTDCEFIYDGTYSVYTNLTNCGETSVEATLIVGVYDGEELLDAHISDKITILSNTTGTIKLDKVEFKKEDYENYNIRCFLWDMENFKPLFIKKTISY